MTPSVLVVDDEAVFRILAEEALGDHPVRARGHVVLGGAHRRGGVGVADAC